MGGVQLTISWTLVWRYTTDANLLDVGVPGPSWLYVDERLERLSLNQRRYW
jgi:hypothetical protein